VVVRQSERCGAVADHGYEYVPREHCRTREPSDR
jgi:hypothetical protein